MTRIFDRKSKSGQLSTGSGGDGATFDAAGVASVSSPAVYLRLGRNIEVLGEPGVDEVEATAGNAAHTITVPTGKYWRLLGLYHTLVTDANVADRAVVVKTRTAADVTIETITHANVAANATAKRTTLFGSDDNVRGDRAVAAQGILTIAEPVTADDQFTLNTTEFTLVSALTSPVVENEILIGANEAATKVNLYAALGGRTGGGTLHTVTDATFAALGMTAIAFVADVMKFTANVKGAAGNALVTAESGNELTHGNNVFNGATLGTTTAGLDAADKVGTLDHPTAGPYLGPGEDINISVTNGVAGDAYDTYLFYLEYDADVD